MDAFEGLISMLLRHEGYWTKPSFKVDLTKGEKRRDGLLQHFASKGWLLFDSYLIRKRLLKASQHGYENDVAFVVSKLLLRGDSVLAELLEVADRSSQSATRRRRKSVPGHSDD